MPRLHVTGEVSGEARLDSGQHGGIVKEERHQIIIHS